MTSILRPWVEVLPLRAQGTLLTAIRGCDEVPKLPLDSTARQLTAAIRYAVLFPADEREVDSEPGAFMQSRPPQDWKPSELGHLPLHFYAHVMHTCEVIGFCHPDNSIRSAFFVVYIKMVNALHLLAETKADMMRRLTEDRIASGTVVS